MSNPDYPEVTAEFHRHFNISFQPFFNELYSVLCTGRIELDVLKFDDYLHSLYGRYEFDRKSMKTIITEHYGAEAADFIYKLINHEWHLPDNTAEHTP